MDKNLIPSESAGEPKVFYYKMKSNFYRYLAECATADPKSKAAEDARVAYAEATKVFQNPDEACKMAHVASEKVQKTVDVPQVQYIDKIADAPVVMRGQVPTIQTVQKTVEVPQVQFIDRVVEVPVVTQRREIPSMPQEQIQEHIVEEIMSRVMEKIIFVVKHIPQERMQNCTEEQNVDVPVPQCRKETGEVIQLLPQDRITDSVVEQTVDIHVQQMLEQTAEVVKAIPQAVVAQRQTSMVQKAKRRLRSHRFSTLTMLRIFHTFMKGRRPRRPWRFQLASP